MQSRIQICQNFMRKIDNFMVVSDLLLNGTLILRESLKKLSKNVYPVNIDSINISNSTSGIYSPFKPYLKWQVRLNYLRFN